MEHTTWIQIPNEHYAVGLMNGQPRFKNLKTGRVLRAPQIVLGNKRYYTVSTARSLGLEFDYIPSGPQLGSELGAQHWLIFIDGKYKETIKNLAKWCRDNGIKYQDLRNANRHGNTYHGIRTIKVMKKTIVTSTKYFDSDGNEVKYA